MSWLVLFVAGLFEIAWSVVLEYSDGLSKPILTVGTVIALVISMVLLTKVIQDLPIGTAYAVWTEIGTVRTASLGIVLFDEPATSVRLLLIRNRLRNHRPPTRLWRALTTRLKCVINSPQGVISSTFR